MNRVPSPRTPSRPIHDHFELSPLPLAGEDGAEPASPATGAGAVVIFIGRVRGENAGRRVTDLEYEASGSLCRAEASRIFAETRGRFPVLWIRCRHRVGRLRPGETAVRVEVGAAHRDEAFRACRFLIDEIKRRLPIWKKEHYADGDPIWIGETNRQAPDDESYYARQMLLPEIGASGQERLSRASVLVVGAGGLGCAVLTSLAQAGIGHLGICEPDHLETSNLHRQSLYSMEAVGRPKVHLARERIEEINPLVRITSHPEAMDAGNAAELTVPYDLILDCTDRLEAKFILNDTAVRTRRELLQAALHRWEGRIWRYSPAARPDSPCLRCLWPRTPSHESAGSCREAGVLGAAVQALGHLQALEAIRILLGRPSLPPGTMFVFDLTAMETRRLRWTSSHLCPMHGRPPETEAPRSNEESDLDWDPMEDPDVSARLREATLIDVRETVEQRLAPLEGIPNLPRPMSRLRDWRKALVPDEDYLLICAHGVRSRRIARRLRADGFLRVRSVRGGVPALLRALRHSGCPRP